MWVLGLSGALGKLKICGDEAIGDAKIEDQLSELRRGFLLSDAEETRV